MFEAEAIRLREIVLARENMSPLLNLGSSTRAFREEQKPHIQACLFGPLERAGMRIVHFDLKQGEGVDVSGDITDPEVAARLKAMGFRSVLLSNLLEHVRDREKVAAACEEIVGPGGLILATVPSSDPYHADPIDTLYRPSPAELAGLFRRSSPLIVEEVTGRTFGALLRERGTSIGAEAVRTILWVLIALARPKSAAARVHRWLWLRRPYRVAIALVEVR
jgi:SAM-dependent methyltransferase